MGDQGRSGNKTHKSSPVVNELIVGRQAVLGALMHGKPQRILIAEDSRGTIITEITALARNKGIVPEMLPVRSFQDRAGFVPGHQGVAAVVHPYRYHDLDQLISSVWQRKKDPLFLMLDHLEDPQNVGAIMRTADAAGADGVIIPAHRAAGVTAAVRKVAAGAAERIPVAMVTNLNRAAESMKQKGLWFYGAEADGETPFYRADYCRPLVLVIGSEGKGLSRLVRQQCDQSLKIPMPGGEAAGSLNVSAATAILLYAALAQREGWSSK
jgi:23S rRNA (guanosine2251-2'-O)-methyltransferase